MHARMHMCVCVCMCVCVYVFVCMCVCASTTEYDPDRISGLQPGLRALKNMQSGIIAIWYHTATGDAPLW